MGPGMAAQAPRQVTDDQEQARCLIVFCEGCDQSLWPNLAYPGAAESPSRATCPEHPCLSSQVYERLEKLQAAVAGPVLEPEAVGHGPPSPQENSYMSTTSSASSSASPRQPLAAPSGASAQAAQRLQKGPNQPVESDESMSGLSAALHSWHLTASCPPGPALPGSPGQEAAVWAPASLGRAGCTRGDATPESRSGGSLEPQPTAVEGNWGQVPRIGSKGPLWWQSPYSARLAFWGLLLSSLCP